MFFCPFGGRTTLVDTIVLIFGELQDLQEDGNAFETVYVACKGIHFVFCFVFIWLMWEESFFLRLMPKVGGGVDRLHLRPLQL